MATLKDTSIKNLLVSENANFNSDVTINGKLNCNDLGLEIVKIQIGSYSNPIVLASNQYVTPFSYHGTVDITNEINSIEGFVCVVQCTLSATSNSPFVARYNYNESTGVHNVICTSGNVNNVLYLQCLRIKPNS